MSHHIYHTRTFVIHSSPRGEANKVFSLFTKDLGLIRGSAQGVRYLKSKLRHSLQDFSLADVALVHGKNGWKIVNAVFQKNFYAALADTSLRNVVARVFSLLRRLIPEEERNEPLFLMVENGCSFFERQVFTLDEVRSAEAALVLRILHNLGYVGDSKTLSPFVESALWDIELLRSLSPLRREALLTINKSLKESHL